jgi:predicted Kef-type K+ transport protein
LVPPAGYQGKDVSWVALALAVAAVVVAGRWCARRVDELGRRRDFPLVGVALLAVLAVGACTW